MRNQITLKRISCLLGSSLLTLLTGLSIALATPSAPIETGVLGDVEGQMPRLSRFLDESGIFKKTATGYKLKDGKAFVFSGDATDRGDSDLAILGTLLSLKQAYPDRVHLILGNRDVNKLRLITELSDESLQARNPHFEEWLASLDAPVAEWRLSKVAKLHWLLRLMGAPDAFEFRRQELLRSKNEVSEDDVLQSYLAELKPNGVRGQYFQHAQIAYFDKESGSLYVHGAVNEENYGRIPGRPGRFTNVEKWVAALNSWAQAEIKNGLYNSHGLQNGAAELTDYQKRAKGMDNNPDSVIAARYTGEGGLPKAPSRGFALLLRSQGINRVVVGHSPYGEVAFLLKENGIELVFSDNSYSRGDNRSVTLVSKDGTLIKSQLDRFGEVTATSRTPSVAGERIPSGEVIVAQALDGTPITFRVGEKFSTIYQTLAESKAVWAEKKMCADIFGN